MKLVFHAMHVNELPFINSGEHIEWAPEISTWMSLGVIVVRDGGGDRRQPRRVRSRQAPRTDGCRSRGHP